MELKNQVEKVLLLVLSPPTGEIGKTAAAVSAETTPKTPEASPQTDRFLDRLIIRSVENRRRAVENALIELALTNPLEFIKLIIEIGILKELEKIKREKAAEEEQERIRAQKEKIEIEAREQYEKRRREMLNADEQRRREAYRLDYEAEIEFLERRASERQGPGSAITGAPVADPDDPVSAATTQPPD